MFLGCKVSVRIAAVVVTSLIRIAAVVVTSLITREFAIAGAEVAVALGLPSTAA